MKNNDDQNVKRVIDLTLPELLQKFEEILKRNIPQIPESQEVKKDLLTVKELCEMLNLAPPTIYALVSKSKIPNMKKGKRVYFSKAQIIKWLESGRRGDEPNKKK